MSEEKKDRYSPEIRAKINAKYQEIINAEEAKGNLHTISNDEAMSIVRQVLEEEAIIASKPTLIFPPKVEESN